jgi:ABC-type transporter Mla subunit MlaD
MSNWTQLGGYCSASKFGDSSKSWSQFVNSSERDVNSWMYQHYVTSHNNTGKFWSEVHCDEDVSNFNAGVRQVRAMLAPKGCRVITTLLLREPIPLRQDYTISIKDAGVLGGKQVYIDPGRAAALPADAALRGEVEPGAFDQIGNIAKGEGKLGGKAVDAVEEIRKFFANMNDPTTSVGKLVTSSALHDQLSDAADSLGRILDAVLEQKGAVGDLVMNAETKENLHGFLASLRSLGKKLDAGTDGVLGVLLNDPDAARNEPGMEPKLKIDGEHSTMAADSLLDPAAACAARRASACLSCHPGQSGPPGGPA